jgi:hypothetical protein
MLLRSRVSGAAVAGAWILASSAGHADQGPAGAPDKAACIKAHDDGQASRAGRKLIDARAKYVTCSHEACPLMIRDECSKGLREVDEALPTIVLSASVEGTDVTDATAFLDGERVSGGLDGRAIPVDPGPHVVRFERQGNGSVEVKLVAREGEKNRLVTGTFMLATSRGGTGRETSQVKMESERFPYVPLAFAGAGVLALGASLFMELDMRSRAEELHATCAPSCPQSDRDALSDRLVLRNVSVGVGLGALAVAAVTYVVGSRK